MNLRVGLRERGPAGMRVVRPRGSGDWVLVQALETLLLDPAHTLRLEPGECALYAPDTPTYLEGAAGSILNSYVHTATPAWETFGLAPATALRPRSGERVSALLEGIQAEWLAREAFWERAVEAHLLELGLLLARGPREPRPTARHDSALLEARARLHGALERAWTVAELAAGAGLSESRFHALYRARFGRSPMQDLLAARLERARGHLQNTALGMAQTAELCGFSDVYYFSRCFKKHVGVAPSQYRRGFFAPFPTDALERPDG